MSNPVLERVSPLRVVFDDAPFLVGYWDRGLRCHYANKACKAWLTAYSGSPGDGGLRELVDSGRACSGEMQLQAALRGAPQEVDCSIRSTDGNRRPALVQLLPHVVAGEVVGMVVQALGMSQLQQAQRLLDRQDAELQRANSLLASRDQALRQAQRLGQMGSWEWEIAADIVSWSEQLYEIFGMDSRLLPPSFAEQPRLYEPRSWARLADAVQRAMTSGEAYVLELEYVHASGRRGWIEARGAVDQDATGEVVMLRGTAQEISARRLARGVGKQEARIAYLERRLLALGETPGQLESGSQGAPLRMLGTRSNRSATDAGDTAEEVAGAAAVHAWPEIGFDDVDFAWVLEALAPAQGRCLKFGAV